MEHLIASILASQTTLIGHVATLAAREPPVPSVTVNNELPEPNVTVNNEVNPTPVTVENHAHVEPTPVVVNVNPEIDVNLPDRQITSVIERDDEGQIANVTQTETTIQ